VRPHGRGAYRVSVFEAGSSEITVRAGDAGACGQNLSGPGGPAYGVLRNRNGPGVGTGSIDINCVQPYVTALTPRYPKAPASDTTNYDVFIQCTRMDPRFEWAEFYAVATYSSFAAGPGPTVSNYFGELFFLDQSAVSTWWFPPRSRPGWSR